MIPSLTPKRSADELRTARLLELMVENPSRSQQELADLMGIGSRNTVAKIIASPEFQMLIKEVRGNLVAQMTAQLAGGVPEVVDYQLAVGAGKIGDMVRDHVGAGRVVRDFLALLLQHDDRAGDTSRPRDGTSIYNAITVNGVEVRVGRAPDDDLAVQVEYEVVG